MAGSVKSTAKLVSAENPNEGVCARVKLRIEQEAVITRDAFRATLELDNNGASRLENVRVDVSIRSDSGVTATNLFAVRLEGVTTLTAVDGTGILAGSSSGTAKWLLVPSVDAAPQVATRFLVGGTLSYRLDGNDVTVNMTEVPITVLPSPQLVLQYFHQRDVFSDDPLTDVIEPSIPYSLAVMVQNKGYGLARNFRITSAQPKIIENKKGLLIDFNIIATEVFHAGDVSSLTPSLTASFGDINPGDTAIGRWLLTSTLQALFIDYTASVKHLDDLGNDRFSIISTNDVSIHEMIHLVQAGGIWEDGKPDFLVNEVPDIRDLPDTLYQSNGSTNHVEVVEQSAVTGTLSPANFQVTLTAPMPGDWVYLRVPDPGDGQYQLARVVRSDGVVVPLNTNAWTTDRTFIGLGRQPIRENILHLLDYNSTGNYTLTYEPATTSINDTNPPVSSVAELPATSRPYFQVSWSGRDEGPLGQALSGLAYYDIYASEDNGPFTPWLQHTPLVSATYIGTLGSRYAFYSVATDANGNREQPPGTPDAETFVSITNSSPLISLPSLVIINEGETLDVAFTASDPDSDQNLAFSLLPSTPPGMSINTSTRHLTWPTGEGNGPSTNLVAIVARDNGLPSLSVTGRVTVVVNEVNSAPTLAPLANRTVNENQQLTFAVSGSDSDLPAQTLTYSLGSGAPAGASIGVANGLFIWTPNELQGGTNYVVNVIVSDNGSPSLSATQSLTIRVRDTQGDFSFSVGSTNLFAGESNSVPLTFVSGIELTDLSFVLDADATRLSGWTLQSLAPEIISSPVQQIGSNQLQIRFLASASNALQGSLTLGRLSFTALSNAHSAIVPLRVSSVQGAQPSGALLANPRSRSGRVFILGEEPLLDVFILSNQAPALALYGKPGHNYQIDAASSLGAPTNWTALQTVQLTATAQIQTLAPSASGAIFYRVKDLSLDPHTLSPRLEAGSLTMEWPSAAGNCALEQCSSLVEPRNWTAAPVTTRFINGRYRVVIPAPGGTKYYRLRCAP